MLLLIVDLSAAPDRRDELARHVDDLLGGGAEGLYQYTIGLSSEDPTALTIVEEWRDEATHAAFVQTAQFARFQVVSAPCLTAAPRSRTFEIHVPNEPSEPPTTISLL